MAEANIYTVGGTVQAGGGIYIPRKADMELLNLCREATFAYVLTPRQMGKSSLMVRTAQTLTEEGISSIVVDLQELGAQVTAEQWYFGFLVKLEDQLMLNTDVVSWWQAHAHLGVSQRLTLFFEQVLLAEVEGRVVIFVDEIDSTLSLDFTDDFFIAIRYLYVARATNSEFHRLSFVLLGVATPGDLIRDAKRTPFNIGQRVDLADFTFEEALPLADGLGLSKDKAQQVLEWVLKWTAGHPYLTQRLCRTIKEQAKDNWTEREIDQVVYSAFFSLTNKQDSNLQFVRDMLTKRSPDLFAVLRTYKDILSEKYIILDEEQSLVKSHLKLTGIVRRDNGRLCVRNLIYKKVFDNKWLQEHLPLPLSLLKAQAVVFTTLVVTLLSLGVRQLGVLQAMELAAYDQMMRSRPDEGPDQRLLIVTIDDADLANQRRKGENLAGTSLSDQSLNALLIKLQKYQPRVIGLDIYRDFPAELPELAQRLQKTDNLIGVCKGSDSTANTKGIEPPPEIPKNRQGFSDFLHDPDGVVRRHLMFFTPETASLCSANYAFSTQLAFRYLLPLGIQPTFTPQGNLQLDNTIFPRLSSRSGGYQGIDANSGQTLLNYRATKKIAETVTLTQILSSPMNSSAIKDRIILIGVTARGDFPDYWATPFSSRLDAQMPGVIVQAHMISQIISAVLDKRPLLTVWTEWGEFLWVWGWSLAGGLLAWRFKQFLYRGLAIGIGATILYLICFIGLSTWAVWIPFIPSTLVFFFTSVSVVASQEAFKQQQRIKISKSLVNKLEIACVLRGENMTDVIARLITQYIEHNEMPTNKTDEQSGKQKH
ncbi:CHASE2 domain-containing protein [Nostoc sp. FACHB-190]|uniref:CHASE2 domain-containing protein n=1 Tax=Nostoc sp. FACHB-190 TaxID=2692838 RepID=UPI0028C4AD3F|nr:CHASE2 domain-containing protein [Nostoc sp. FACHB-190]